MHVYSLINVTFKLFDVRKVGFMVNFVHLNKV